MTYLPKVTLVEQISAANIALIEAHNKITAIAGGLNHARARITELEKQKADLEKKIEDVARGFESVTRCHECGSPVCHAVSLIRCATHPRDHHMIGPSIAFEIREKMKD